MAALWVPTEFLGRTDEPTSLVLEDQALGVCQALAVIVAAVLATLALAIEMIVVAVGAIILILLRERPDGVRFSLRKLLIYALIVRVDPDEFLGCDVLALDVDDLAGGSAALAHCCPATQVVGRD